jgi:hypothetical protein
LPSQEEQNGRFLHRPQQDYPAATVAEFCTAVLKLCILCKDSFLPIAFLVQVAASWSCLSDYEWLLLLRSVLVHASAAIDRNPPFFPAPSQTL